tara:strand:+ start:1619 stop:2050 length:432 start_codon:yes stop_codon:yes gene_type:complete
MKLDKTMFLILAIITLFFIVGVGILTRYGSNISDDPSFKLFFNWYIALVLINLLNILTTVLFHYFMTDLPGERGNKGKVGEKGLQGDDDMCFCRDENGAVNTITLDDTQTIHSHTIRGGEPSHTKIENPEGSLIHRHTGHPSP